THRWNEVARAGRRLSMGGLVVKAKSMRKLARNPTTSQSEVKHECIIRSGVGPDERRGGDDGEGSGTRVRVAPARIGL
ncbi:MAG: hypothetical protein V3V08_16700, partial [Nannocystaceae bacterium]